MADVTGNGDVNGDVIGIINGNINGSVYGNIIGIVNGIITGDVHGAISGRVSIVNGRVLGGTTGSVGNRQDPNRYYSTSISFNNTTNNNYIPPVNPLISHREQESFTTNNSVSNRTVNREQIIQYESTSDDQEDTCCPICLESLTEIKRNTKRVMSTICGHLICNECSNAMFTRTAVIECPKCRSQLRREQVHVIYF